MNRVTHFIHRNFLLLLILCYAMAGFLPQFGNWLRHISLASVSFPGSGTTRVSPSVVMLALLLFNAGLGIKARELSGLLHKSQMFVFGFLANSLVPVLLILVLRGVMGLWHNPLELQNLLVGLALIAAMPIAGSSVAWSQNANGNVSLSLGLVFLSALLSPVMTPCVLQIFASITQGDYSEDLQELAQQGVNSFLCLTVVLPACIGICSHFLLGEKRAALIIPRLKLVNFVFLLLLNYANASTSLPAVFQRPDWDYLAFIAFATITMCLTAFFAGWLIGKFFGADRNDLAGLMFSLGMNNNGTGLVLAAATLGDHPDVLLPIIFYTLSQQIIAAFVDRKLFKSENWL